MIDDVKKQKITIICNSCGEQFTTNIGWAAKKGKSLVCSKCSAMNEIHIGNDIDVNGAIKILKESGIKIQ